jgi:predicted GNAT family acetyltransferase
MNDVQDDGANSEYVITVDGARAGVAHYVSVDGGRVFDHTKIDADFEGQGLGSALARGALDDVRARGIHIGATCPFIVSFLERHPEYQDLVDPSLVDRVR